MEFHLSNSEPPQRLELRELVASSAAKHIKSLLFPSRMAQSKSRNSKSKRQHGEMKKNGKQDDIAQLRSQLDALSLQIIQVTADGNCFFRSLADQLEGNEQEHEIYRKTVVQYIKSHRQDFEPFIEDGVPFDEYCNKMEKDGTWAGHMELQATSLVKRINICIHRAMSPRWYIRNFGDNEASMIHLSYHNGEHYNSVRLKSDPCEGPARPIIIKADSNLSLLDHNQKAKANGLKGLGRMSLCDTGSVKLVMAGTGCENLSKIEQVLHEVSGDVDAAIEFLIAEQESIENDNSVVSENFGDHHEISCDEQVVAASGMTSETPSQASGDSSTSDEKHESNSQNNRPNEKRIQRNTDCPCGSRRKYKACCGTATRKPSAVMLNKNCGSSNRRKGMKGREPDHIRATSTYGSEVSDLGALCI